MTGRLLLAGTAAVGAAAVLALGGGLREAAADPLDGRGARGLVELAVQDLQRVRETGDPAYYAPAERALRRAQSLAPDDAGVLRAAASLNASRHRFAESLALAERARELEPEVAAVYGLIGDANLELGRYDAAFAAFERQVALKPTSAAYARIAYARELLGDLEGAVAAMALAAEAAPAGEPAAWARSQLGALELAAGHPEAAESRFREALSSDADYAPALEGLAELASRRGRSTIAIALLRRAEAATADPGPAVALADALALAGREVEAEQAYREAEARERRFARFGGRNQLETAELDLNRDRRLRDALARARAGYRERPSVEGAHVLAWALYKNGRCGEARRYSDLSMRLGTKDVDGLFHRSLIERCLGDERAGDGFLARVRALDPLYLRTAPSAFRLGS